VSRKRKEPIELSEAELQQMTAELDEMHHATLPAMREALDQWNEFNRDIRGQIASSQSTRRGFLMGAGVALGGLAIAACGSSSKNSSGGNGSSATTAPAGSGGTAQQLTGDLAIVALAAALENSAVATYQAGIDAATAGKLGTVPPAVVTFAKTAQSHHKDHAAAWNSVLVSNGKKSVTRVDKTVQDGVVTPAFAKVTDVAGLAKLALELENVAGSTYLSAIGAIGNKDGIKVAASIEPVELQHAAILNFVLGNYPVPDGFTPTAGARTTTDVIAAA
jgi:hypothetical protein